MKTSVCMIPTNQPNFNTGENGRTVWIRTLDGNLMSRRLKTLLDRNQVLTIPVQLLSDLKNGFINLLDKMDPVIREMIFSMVDEDDYEQLYEYGKTSGELLRQLYRTAKADDEEWPEDIADRIDEARLYLGAYRATKGRYNTLMADWMIAQEYLRISQENVGLAATVDVLNKAMAAVSQENDRLKMENEGMRIRIEAMGRGINNLVEFA